MVKKVNNSTPLQLLSNSGHWIEHLEQRAFMHHPEKDAWRKRLIHTMHTWADRDTSLEILQFCREYKIPRRTLTNYVNDYQDIREAYEDVKLAIACRRRVGTMERKYDGAYAYKDMHLLDPEWDAVNKYHDERKKDVDKTSNHVFNVTLPVIENSTLVPEKK